MKVNDRIPWVAIVFLGGVIVATSILVDMTNINKEGEVSLLFHQRSPLDLPNISFYLCRENRKRSRIIPSPSLHNKTKPPILNLNTVLP